MFWTCQWTRMSRPTAFVIKFLTAKWSVAIISNVPSSGSISDAWAWRLNPRANGFARDVPPTGRKSEETRVKMARYFSSAFNASLWTLFFPVTYLCYFFFRLWKSNRHIASLAVSCPPPKKYPRAYLNLLQSVIYCDSAWSHPFVAFLIYTLQKYSFFPC